MHAISTAGKDGEEEIDKVKLTPGSRKRGKAARQARAFFAATMQLCYACVFALGGCQ